MQQQPQAILGETTQYQPFTWNVKTCEADKTAKLLALSDCQWIWCLGVWMAQSQRLETDGEGGKISGFDLVQPTAAEKSHWQWGGLWCAAGFRQMGRMAGLVVAKRLIDIIRATDNSVLAGPRRSLAR